MRKLEYRLDNGTDYPALYYYNGIDKDEISLRYDCDYFIKDGVVYEKTGTEEKGSTYIIYVVEAEDESADVGQGLHSSYSLFQTGFKFELRHFKGEETADHPLVTLLNIQDDDDLTLKLKSDYINVNGRRWAKTSAEIDEDRKTFVYYAEPK
jgi:hypothetical protein